MVCGGQLRCHPPCACKADFDAAELTSHAPGACKRRYRPLVGTPAPTGWVCEQVVAIAPARPTGVLSIGLRKCRANTRVMGIRAVTGVAQVLDVRVGPWRAGARQVATEEAENERGETPGQGRHRMRLQPATGVIEGGRMPPGGSRGAERGRGDREGANATGGIERGRTRPGGSGSGGDAGCQAGVGCRATMPRTRFQPRRRSSGVVNGMTASSIDSDPYHSAGRASMAPIGTTQR